MNKKALLNAADEAVAKAWLRLFGERGGLSSFLFHGIYSDAGELERRHIFPQERMTVALFRRFLDYFLEAGYRFVSPNDVKAGLPDAKAKYGLVTFDDGYFNNTLILDVLAEYSVPAIFFIATAYVAEGVKFWSDAVYTERSRHRVSDAAILREIMQLKQLKVAEIQDYITREFGTDALQPLSDIDRPLTVDELKSFAEHPYVHVGNHTHWHEVLTNLSNAEIVREFELSQALLREWTGARPYFVSYPNGSFNKATIGIAKHQGLSLGISTIAYKTKTPLPAGTTKVLGRFNPVAVGSELELSKFRSRLQLKTQLKQWLQ
jgi:peptidoglycan/xylan/chitin deacetylase (PgdA/CDA1 family)